MQNANIIQTAILLLLAVLISCAMGWVVRTRFYRATDPDVKAVPENRAQPAAPVEAAPPSMAAEPAAAVKSASKEPAAKKPAAKKQTSKSVSKKEAAAATVASNAEKPKKACNEMGKNLYQGT